MPLALRPSEGDLQRFDFGKDRIPWRPELQYIRGLNDPFHTHCYPQSRPPYGGPLTARGGACLAEFHCLDSFPLYPRKFVLHIVS